MYPDTDLHRGRVPAVVIVERALDADCALHSLAGRVERDHEAIASCFDLLASVLLNLAPQNAIVLTHDLMSSSLALMLAKPRGADDVAEEHRYGRGLVHGVSQPPKASGGDKSSRRARSGR